MKWLTIISVQAEPKLPPPIGRGYPSSNISRYISTAKPEEKINLDEVNTKLVDLEKEITMTENKHNEYLKELGLPSLL